VKLTSRTRKNCYVIGLLAIVSIFLFLGFAIASSEGGHAATTDRGKDLLWRTMNFVLLAGVLIYLLRKPVVQALESKRRQIKDQLTDLERQRREAEERISEYNEKLARLDREVEKIIAEYGRQGEALKAKIIEEAKVAAQKLQEQARKEIEREFQEAKQRLRAEIAEGAVHMAEELIKKHITDEDQERLIEQYLTKVVTTSW